MHTRGAAAAIAKPLVRVSALLASAVTFGACAANGLVVRVLRGTAAPPSNVALYFRVSLADGTPVADLPRDALKLYEDGWVVDAALARPTLVDPRLVSTHYVLLLVDVSGRVRDARRVDPIVAASMQFYARLSTTSQVAVAAFDGGPQPFVAVPFGHPAQQPTRTVRGALERLRAARSREHSANLGGAVVDGVAILQRALDADPKSLKSASLVLVTAGGDDAHRVGRRDLRDALVAADRSEIRRYLVTTRGAEDDDFVEEILHSGAMRVSAGDDLGESLLRVAARIEETRRSVYVLTYCSPARGGDHFVRVEARSGGLSGAATFPFTSQGFSDGCDPEMPPDFDGGSR